MSPLISPRIRLIVGLGNPGDEYTRTPHNMGFLAVDGLAERAGIRVTRPESKSYVGLGKLAGNEIVLAKPQTMMNLSGIAVRMLIERYECQAAETIVLTDDVDLPWGMLRIRERGSAGTHNGLKSVVRSLGTEDFPRVRLGIRPEKIWGELRDYVLCPMGRAEREVAAQMVKDAGDAVEAILTDGVNKAMSRFNRRVPPDEESSQ